MATREGFIGAFIGTKGGTTKTSNCANIGGMLADMGQRVLLIDGDPQQSLSAYFQLSHRASHGFKRFLTKADPTDCISKTNIPHLDIIINDDPCNELKLFFKNTTHYDYLKHGISQLRSHYDVILIDTKGESDGAVQESVIKAADHLIAPVTTDYMAAKEFKRGTLAMLQRLRGPEGVELFSVPPLIAILSRIKVRTSASRAVTGQLRAHINKDLADSVTILDTVVYEKEAYNRACGRRLPVHRIDPVQRKDRPTQSAYDLQLALVRELFPALQHVFPSWDGMPSTLMTRQQNGCSPRQHPHSCTQFNR